MSLVAYDASSDEESDYEVSEGSKIVENISTKISVRSTPDKAEVSVGHISDDDEFIPQYDAKEKYFTSLSKLLPKPKTDSNIADILNKLSKPTFNALPAPKLVVTHVTVEEEDDEFLHKKPSKEIIENTNKYFKVKKMPVKISIPSLKNFQDVEDDLAEKVENKSNFTHSNKTTKSSGLLNMLPRAKSEQCFARETTTVIATNIPNATREVKSSVPSFIPDSVKHHRPAANTEDVERCNRLRKNFKNEVKILSQNNKQVDTDESDDDNVGNDDFFSFNTDQSLPEVSAKEINSLVAKKTAKIIEASKRFLKISDEKKSLHEDVQICEQELESSRKRHHVQQSLNSEALEALVGSSTKRRRQKTSIQLIEINSSQVMPNKDEWMRTALASSTSYQPTGVLVDEEPASGTRRKHQITYLAHKAKANEAELQAMWSANRQNRRATQSKYGF